jgi:hypothetical protein
MFEIDNTPLGVRLDDEIGRRAQDDATSSPITSHTAGGEAGLGGGEALKRSVIGVAVVGNIMN